MNSFLRLRLLWLVPWLTATLVAQVPKLPIELRPDLATINLSSRRGVPLSNTQNTPVGSDGRAPAEGTQLPPLPTTAATVRQFSSAMSFGGGVRPVYSAQANTNLSLAANAVALNLPRLGGNTPTHILLRAQIGSPFVSRGVSYLFGSVIRPPVVDETGKLLSESNLTPETYWSAEPYSTNGHAGAYYYWSPNARVVFATRPGPVDITWKRLNGLSSQPTNSAVRESGLWYTLYTQRVLVSGSLSKASRVIYWTEGDFSKVGKPVQVPGNRVSDIRVVFNDQIPERVTSEYRGGSQIVTTNRLEETRTLWFDRSTSQIRAYNAEGRVFVELLGDRDPNGITRKHLGFEIVDVLQQATPQTIGVALGDRLKAFADPNRDDSMLYPDPVTQMGDRFLEINAPNTSAPSELYAVRETRNINDVLVYWMEDGVEGLRWPRVFSRYEMSWPADPGRYSHYLRPSVGSKEEAKRTAVLMNANNVPLLLYQDSLDNPRAFLDPDLYFYTYLTSSMPAHRSLLRYNSGNKLIFERVFSWLDANLTATNWSGTVAASLSSWNKTNSTMTFPAAMDSPRIVSQTVDVGRRLVPPSGEVGADGSVTYLAGYIRSGTSYHPGAYKNPFTDGFEAANKSSIIPVNAIPNANVLEVWWFRRSSVLVQEGLSPIAWPSVMARYTIQFPTSPKEIVLASNAGTGPLSSMEARGSIYVQNDPQGIGYNPNEEHALMIGGQGYALRDDLNITSGANFSSQPFVLIDYFAEDDRPSMSVFRVLREKPTSGILFDYVVEAGRILQPPMPLPLLQPPTEGQGVGMTNYNREVAAASGSGNLPVNWSETRDGNGAHRHYKTFSYLDRNNSFWVYRGLHQEPNLQSGRYISTNRTYTNLPAAVAISGRPYKYYIHTSRRPEGLIVKQGATTLPNWLRVDTDASGLFLGGTPPSGNATATTYTFELIDLGLSQTNSLSLSIEVRSNGSESTQSALTVNMQMTDGTSVDFVGRPPFLAARASDTNSFSMRFYYKTQEGFAWPNLNAVPVGTIVPYLRPVGSVAGTYTGDAASKTTDSLPITYRPVWPAIPAVLRPGQTLTRAVNGLPAIRGQTSARVLYQQSIATNITLANPSVVLIDPTRMKTASLSSASLTRLPSGILTEDNQGLTYFPNLPPHLASRVYYDPNIGVGGSLVLKGEFKDEPVGEKYLFLNVLRGTEAGGDLKAVLDLCPTSPAADRTKWETLVNGLAASVETFRENPNIPGNFLAQPTRRVSVGVGSMVEISDDETAVDSYALSASGPGYGMVSVVVGNGRAFTPPGEPVSIHVFRVVGGLWPGELKVVPSANPLNEQLTLQHTPDLGGRFGQFEYQWKIAAPADGAPPAMDGTMSRWTDLQTGNGLPRYTLGGAGVRVLSDNYLTMRYRSTNTTDAAIGQWSSWTTPQLAEGWIKRVLAGINPFQQRVKDLYNNAVSTDVSVISQAGRRWEGAIALSLNNINQSGLIEIYETVLRRGRDLSINAGINYGPANDALLLVAGYLNDLYSLMGDEAKADAANPTIATGSGGAADGSVATAKFSFAGQLPSLLEEELALLRGRDDFMQPGVQTAPAYNRLYWNFTRGINSGEVIYTENYNIKDFNSDGIIDAADAAEAYPQGHGDAYGHYLTGLKGYYSLLINSNFSWVPRSEAVTILGKAIQVDYVDERKFAAAAGALSQTGLDVLKLVFRQSYRSGDVTGWDRFGETRRNTNRAVTTVRHWGVDHWATRAGQGAYINWVVGNSMLPYVDPDPTHEGIQKIDRTTVPELTQLPLNYREIQQVLDNAEAGLTPLGLPRDSLALDINPNLVTGADPKGHFEQLYERTVSTLENAALAFEEAGNMSTSIRSEGNTLEDEKASIQDNERELTTRLIGLYGTPYTDDIGPGKTYMQDYAGPDLLHYMYVDMPEYTFPDDTGEGGRTFEISLPGLPSMWSEVTTKDFYAAWEMDKSSLQAFAKAIQFPELTTLKIQVDANGFTPRPAGWTGRRASPGRIQQAISELIAAQRRLALAWDDVGGARDDFQKAVSLFRANWQTAEEINTKQNELLIANQALESVLLANDLFDEITAATEEAVGEVTEQIQEALPQSMVAGLAAGGDLTSAGRSAIKAVGSAVQQILDKLMIARNAVVRSLEFATATTETWSEFNYILPRERRMELRQSLNDLAIQLQDVHGLLWTVNQRRRELDDAEMKLRALIAEGQRIQADRQAFRTRAAALIQGYRTRDVVFRLFRNEKLERYRTLMDLASSYSLLTANAYDYETGLLGSSSGKAFVDRILQARALGVVRNGRPQFTGGGVGDPGLSGALAEMNSDWQVLKGRLGFNNPDAYGTTMSLRTENFRILPSTDGDTNWKDVLNRARKDDLLQDVDVKRLCLQLDKGDGLAVPGLILEFSTTIADGMNFFGQPLAAGDHAFHSSAFATKVFGVGVALEGYKGMDAPSPNAGAVTGSGGSSPADPNLAFTDPNALAATPYVYLIPVGLDSMRSPPLGDQTTVRTWSVQDVTVPMPFNIGASDFSTKKLWQSTDSLSEPLFSIRKHQAFRPVPAATYFTPNIYGGGGLARSQFTNSRLIGRSVWNSRWKLVIPGQTLLNNSAEGLDRFIQSVKDVKLHIVSYSYSGN